MDAEKKRLFPHFIRLITFSQKNWKESLHDRKNKEKVEKKEKIQGKQKTISQKGFEKCNIYIL